MEYVITQPDGRAISRSQQPTLVITQTIMIILINPLAIKLRNEFPEDGVLFTLRFLLPYHVIYSVDFCDFRQLEVSLSMEDATHISILRPHDQME